VPTEDTRGRAWEIVEKEDKRTEGPKAERTRAKIPEDEAQRY